MNTSSANISAMAMLSTWRVARNSRGEKASHPRGITVKITA